MPPSFYCGDICLSLSAELFLWTHFSSPLHIVHYICKPVALSGGRCPTWWCPALPPEQPREPLLHLVLAPYLLLHERDDLVPARIVLRDDLRPLCQQILFLLCQITDLTELNIAVTKDIKGAVEAFRLENCISRSCCRLWYHRAVFQRNAALSAGRAQDAPAVAQRAGA